MHSSSMRSRCVSCTMAGCGVGEAGFVKVCDEMMERALARERKDERLHSKPSSCLLFPHLFHGGAGRGDRGPSHSIDLSKLWRRRCCCSMPTS